MPKAEFTTAFWRWYFERYTDYNDIPRRKTVLTNVKNVFNGQKDDLTIDFEKGVAIWDDQAKPIAEFLVLYHNTKPDYITEKLRFAQDEYQNILENGGDEEFFFNKDTYSWIKNEGKETRAVTNFNIVFESIIRIYNMDERVWERHYECYIEFEKDRKVVKSPTFRLTPDDCLTTAAFQAAIWKIDFRQSWWKSHAELQWFFTFLNDYYRPRVVSQYDHFGFITYERRKYYLSRNLLVKIPKNNNEQLELIAPDEQNCFHVEGDHYIQLDPNLEPAPHFDLGPVDMRTGLYKQDMDALISEQDFKKELDPVIEHLNHMVAGQVPESREGELVAAYLFSYLFFEDIYKTFTHIIFLYIYGRANTGKGKLSEIILAFFGIPFIDSMTHPTKAALENNLASHSQIPAWIDEFVPEIAGHKSYIPDQLFNTWFELRVRNISSAANRKRNDAKISRTMLMFCSNYLPETDHLNSRLLKIEYSVQKRGDETHYYWLANNKQLLQRLFLSSLQWYHQFDRSFYSNLLVIYKKKLKENVSTILQEKKEKTGLSYNLEDRQIEQMAALCATWLFVIRISSEIVVLKKNLDVEERSKSQETFINTLLNHPFYNFALEALAENAQQVGMTDPLAEFLNIVGYLVDDHTINEKHYHWTPEGDLKLWWGGIWAAYEKFKGNIATNKELIRRMVSGLSENPGGSTLVWTGKGLNRTVRKHGYKIKNAKEDKRFAYAFQWEDPNQLPGMNLEEEPGF